MAARKLEVVFIGDTKDLDRAFTRVGAQADGFAAKMQATGKKMQGVGRTLNRNVSLPIVAIGAASGKLALDFETAMGKVDRLVGISSEQVGKWSDQILAMAKDLPQSPKELADALYFVTSSGIETSKVMEVLDVSARTAATGLTDTQTAANLLTSVIGAYGAKNIDAAKSADALFAAVREGKSEPDELAGAMSRAIPMAAQMGVEFEEVAGGMAALSLSGNDAHESATQLSSLFKTFIRPTAAVSGALDKIGWSADRVKRSLKNRGLLPTLMDLRKASKENGQAFEDLFPNVRALRGALQLTGPTAAKNADIFREVANSSGQMGEAFKDTASNSKAFRLQSAMSSIQVSAIQLGSVVLPIAADAFEQLAGAVGDAGEWFSNLDPAMQSFIVKAGAVMAVVGPLVVVLGTVIRAVGTIALAVAKFGGIVMRVAKFVKSWILPLRGLALVLGGPLMLAIGAVIVAVVLLIKHWDWVKRAVGNVWRWLKGAASDTFGWVANAVKDAWNAVKSATSATWNWIKGALSKVWGAIRAVAVGYFNAYRSIITGTWRTIRNVTTSIWNGLKRALSGVWGAIRSAASALWGAIRDAIVSRARGARDTVLAVVRYLRDRLTSLWGAIKSAASSAWSSFRSRVIGPVRDAVATVRDLIGRGKGGLIHWLGDRVSDIKKVADRLARPFIRAFNRMKDVVGDLLSHVRKVIGLVKDVASLLGKIKVPKINFPDLNPLGGFGGGNVGPGRGDPPSSVDGFNGAAARFGLMVTSGYRPGDDGYHGLNRARDYSNGFAPTPGMMAFARYMVKNFGSRLKELIYSPLGYGIKNGAVVPNSFWGAGTVAGHYNHVHVAMAQGGLVKTRVGELGAEDVYLPGGARVVQASETAQGDRVNGAPVIGEVHIHGGGDEQEIARRLAWLVS